MRCYSKRKKPKHWSKPKWKKHSLANGIKEIFFLLSRSTKDKYKENDYFYLLNRLGKSNPLDPKGKIYITVDGKRNLIKEITEFI